MTRPWYDITADVYLPVVRESARLLGRYGQVGFLLPVAKLIRRDGGDGCRWRIDTIVLSHEATIGACWPRRRRRRRRRRVWIAFGSVGEATRYDYVAELARDRVTV